MYCMYCKGRRGTIHRQVHSHTHIRSLTDTCARWRGPKLIQPFQWGDHWMHRLVCPAIKKEFAFYLFFFIPLFKSDTPKQTQAHWQTTRGTSDINPSILEMAAHHRGIFVCKQCDCSRKRYALQKAWICVQYLQACCVTNVHKFTIF